MNHYPIAIVGAGPAGMSCAIQLRRMGLEPVVFERREAQSTLRLANRVENYLGFPEGITGDELYRHFREQYDRFQVETLYKEVRKIGLQDGMFSIDTGDMLYTADVLVLATGTRPKKSTLPTWNESIGNCIHYDISVIALRDNLATGIIGLGDAAFDYALNLHRRGHKVIIFGRSENIGANRALMEQFRKTGGIGLLLNHVLISVDELVEGKIRCRFRKIEQVVEHNLDCLIFATGREANLEFLEEAVVQRLEELKQSGKLYLAGDVSRGGFRQTAIATGDGIRVAMEIFQYESHTKNRR